jgi:CDP-diacylglycerol---glycerol-3-phosphate 3-phosphatidyltransferase
MNLPNQLTVARLGLAILFVFACSLSVPFGWTAGLVLFVLASITDYLDGKIARERGLITNFGKLMDPLADKVLMAAGFVVLCESGDISALPIVLILTREFFVTGLRTLAVAENVVMAADRYGKLKTILQITTLIYFLTGRAAMEYDSLAQVSSILRHPILEGVLIWSTVALTLASGWGYLWKNRQLLRTQ